MTNTGKGALIGGGGGGALGAGVGALIGGGKGAAIGSAIGAAVGAGAGALIGKKMDKQAEQLKQQLANAENPNTDVQIYGYTDNTGSLEVNTRVANGRAAAVESFLANSGIAPTRLQAQGIPMANYVASNDTAAGRAQNRRVEIYITADQTMINEANNGTLQ